MDLVIYDALPRVATLALPRIVLFALALEAMQESAELARRLARALVAAGFVMESVDAIGGDIYDEIHDDNWYLDDEAPPAQ